MKKIGIIAMLLMAFMFIGCGSNYSNGDRVGTISKFSKKGLLMKSWEGQMVLGGLVSNGDGGMNANTFNFTVTDPDVVEKIQTYMDSGFTVKVTYNEWLVSPPSMESGYEVTNVSKVNR